MIDLVKKHRNASSESELNLSSYIGNKDLQGSIQSAENFFYNKQELLVNKN